MDEAQYNDILSALDNDNISFFFFFFFSYSSLFLLFFSSCFFFFFFFFWGGGGGANYSAPFYTVDHRILFSHLNSVFGIQSTALQWFQSYLSGKYHSTSVNNHLRHHHSSHRCTSGLSTGARSLRSVQYTSLRYHS